ncbi:hypothetical protein RIF29_21591 [Crotalaria pallida]|uniref:Uncharacterized protein n=1 Tax=Crotalaria pallida TaxID=3830 RepID=A0AAN9I7B8_CROPI
MEDPMADVVTLESQDGGGGTPKLRGTVVRSGSKGRRIGGGDAYAVVAWLWTLVVGAYLAVDLLVVEIPVAIAGGAKDNLQCAFIAGGNELTTAVLEGVIFTVTEPIGSGIRMSQNLLPSSIQWQGGNTRG